SLGHRLRLFDCPAMGAAHYERVPQLQDIDTGTKYAREIEKPRLAVRAMGVMHGHFDNLDPCILDLLHHLQADDAAVLLETYAVEDRPPEQAEITIDVAHVETEQCFHRVVIDTSDDDPM